MIAQPQPPTIGHTNLRPILRAHLTAPAVTLIWTPQPVFELQRQIRGTQQQTAWDVKPAARKHAGSI